MDEKILKNSESNKQLFLLMNILNIVATTLLLLLIIWRVKWTSLIVIYTILFVFILYRNKLDWTRNPILTIKKAKRLNYISAVFMFWTFLFDVFFEYNREFIYLGLIATPIGIIAMYIAHKDNDSITKSDIIDGFEIDDTPLLEKNNELI